MIVAPVAWTFAAGALGDQVYRDACDASAAVLAPAGLIVVADDESNVLRVFDTAKPGRPVSSYNLSKHLDAVDAEADIEGAARLGDRVYWITSHGRNSKGKRKPERHRLFATRVTAGSDGARIEPVGGAFADLAKTLAADPRFKALGLADAVGGEGSDPDLAPEKDGLNIEGLAATADGAQLLIALRNPRREGKALIVPLRNPGAVVELGARPDFGDPVRLDLGGLGIRSIEYCEACEAHLIVAGSHTDGANFALHLWKEGSRPERVQTLSGLTPEALVIDEAGRRALLLSDDGDKGVRAPEAQCREGFESGTCKCKHLTDPLAKSFRGRWIGLPVSGEPRAPAGSEGGEP